MKSLFSLSCVLAAAIGVNFFSQFVLADNDLEPEEVTVPIRTAYIPGGFDSNDSAEVTVEGYFPNTCYRVGPSVKEKSSKTPQITIRQKAFLYKGMCLQMIVPFSQTVKVGILKAKEYKIVDANSGSELGTMPVGVAKNSGPDDYLYATIDDAYIESPEGGAQSVILKGELPGSCWKLKEKRVLLDGKNVISLLPIIEKIEGENCDEVRVPFTESVELPQVKSGRYLLNVRSLNGKAVAKLVNL